jgi:hypothetical protein
MMELQKRNTQTTNAPFDVSRLPIHEDHCITHHRQLLPGVRTISELTKTWLAHKTAITLMHGLGFQTHSGFLHVFVHVSYLIP